MNETRPDHNTGSSIPYSLRIVRGFFYVPLGCELKGYETGKTKVKSLLTSQKLIRPALISSFSSMKRLGVFILPPGWDASPSQGYPQHYAGTHLYTWVERSTVRVKCLAQEHNTMSPARTRTRTTRSGVERTNHEATAPPTMRRGLRFIVPTREDLKVLTICGCNYKGSTFSSVILTP